MSGRREVKDPLALPAGIVLDRWFRGTLAAGALLTAAAAVIRTLGGYGPALLCAVLAAVAQPLVLNAISKLADGYLPERQRPQGIAVAAAANLAGMLAALSLGGIVFVGFGVFIALTTWLEPLLKPAGVNASTAGTLLALLVLSGIVGSVVLPAPIVHRQLERRALGHDPACGTGD